MVFPRKVLDTILDLLRQGVSPEKIALAISLGLMLAIIPVLGVTTILCTAAALTLRLNMVVIQMVNALAWPLQLLLFIPFYRAGAMAFDDTSFGLTLKEVQALVRESPWNATVSLFWAGVHAVAVWSAVAPVAGALLYFVLAAMLRRSLAKSA